MENHNKENLEKEITDRVARLMRRQNTGKICPLRSSDNKIVYCGCECAWYDSLGGCIIHRIRFS